MEKRLQDALGGVEVAEPVSADRMQVFGLRWNLPGEMTYLTLDEALEAKMLEVTEVNEGGSVPEINLSNKGDMMVFLMAGEQLIGAKQNRVVNASMMVPGRSKRPIPVSCVERGRWGYRSRQFRSGGSSSHAKLRHMMMRKATEGYRRERRPSSNQMEVWGEVDRKMMAMRSHSPSDELQQVYEDHREPLEKVARDISAPEGCSGAVFAIGDRIAGVELFDQPETLAKLWPKLVKSYAIDAREEAFIEDLRRRGGEPQPDKETLPIDREAVSAWLRSSMELPSERYDSPGLGDDIRIESTHMVGASLLVEDCPVHTELFAEGGTE
ncbi:MAG: ARPP-1 family domain-containing protein [Phycisphaerae bacterium]